MLTTDFPRWLRLLGARLAGLADECLPAACIVCGGGGRVVRDGGSHGAQGSHGRNSLHGRSGPVGPGWAARGLCAACAAALPGSGARRCPRCGVGLEPWCEPGCEPGREPGREPGLDRWLDRGLESAAEHPSPAWPECEACRDDPPPFDCTIAAADYLPPLDRLIHALKFGRDSALARPLGQWLAQRLPGAMTSASPLLPPAPLAPTAPLVTAVPLAAERLAERGFNQSLEIARALARYAGLPLAATLLRRPRAAAAAATLDAAERREALRGAFVAQRRIDGRDVLLVDDVMTTGATLSAAADALKRAGAASVVNCIVARTPAPHVPRRSGPP